MSKKAEDELDNLGPAWSSLTEKQRTFVLVWANSVSGDREEALAAAGFSVSTPAVVNTTFYRLMANEDVKAALREAVAMNLSSSSAVAIATLQHIAANGRRESDKIKAAELLLDRGGFHRVSEVKTTVENLTGTREAMVRQLRLLARRNPDAIKTLPPHIAGLLEDKVIDAEFRVVDKDADIGL